MRSDLQSRFVKNLAVFLIPMFIIYLGSVTGQMSVPNHVFGAGDFIPNTLTVGSILTYVMNALIDFKRKLDAS